MFLKRHLIKNRIYYKRVLRKTAQNKSICSIYNCPERKDGRRNRESQICDDCHNINYPGILTLCRYNNFYYIYDYDPKKKNTK